MKPEIIHLSEIESTNIYVKGLEERDSLPEGSVYYADFQLAGKGQRGNSWESERGENLLFSIIIHPYHVSPIRNFILSQTIAIAVVEVLDEYIDGATVKWPNDIYYGDKKLGGILIENELRGEQIVNSIIGVGLNVNQLIFRSDAPNPISLHQITSQKIDIRNLLGKIQTKFIALYNSLPLMKNDIEDTYMERLYRKKGFYTYQDAEGTLFDARIRDVEESGILVLELENKEVRRFTFKEVRCVL